METQILKLLAQPRYTPLNIPGLLAALGLPPNQQQQLQRVVAALDRSAQIVRLKGNRYARPLDADLVPGRIRINRQGVGYLQPDDRNEPELTIPADCTSTALHNDHVLARRDVRPLPAHRRGRPSEQFGQVIRILKRARTRLVGTLQRGKQFLYVIPDDPRIPHDIYVPPARPTVGEPKLGDKVVVKMIAWESRHTNPEGEIVELLGTPGVAGVDMLSILRQYNLPLHFSKPLLHEAAAFGSEVHSREWAGRVDCRSHPVVTIDPDDAKDFDDAICLQPTPDQNWKLWVHIADVSHYVRPDSLMDAEAAERGNSTYLVDRVIPMLPEGLSNELCSLKPNVDRLTKCAEFLLSPEGRVLKTNFYSAVINSKRRFSYQEAFAVLQRRPADPIEQMLHDANRLAQTIRRARMAAGSLNLDFPESKIRLDERGQVARIDRVENDLSHQLIEEFMLLANEAAARRLQHLNRPAIYRVHEPPDADRLQEFREDVLGHRIPCGDLKHRPEVQKLLQRLDRLPIGEALKIGFLKSLMRARYAIESLGHYGLAKVNYTHFTSPIRRYADLVVHRALFQPAERSTGSPGKAAHHQRPAAAGAISSPGNSPDRKALSQPLKQLAEHLSDTERNSSEAEQDSKNIKLFAFLAAQLKAQKPERYPALVSDVRNFGFFVDVPTLGLRGLVPLSLLKDEFYQFDSGRSQLVGRRTRRVIKLGDTVEVQVAKVDTFKKQVDFRLAETKRAPVRGSKAARSGARI